MKFGIKEYRETSTDPANVAYAILGQSSATDSSLKRANIWDIVKYTGISTYEQGNFYCVRSGLGFSDTHLEEDYNISYNFAEC